MSPLKVIQKKPEALLFAAIAALSLMIYFVIFISRSISHPEHLSFDRYLFADLCALLNASVVCLLISGRLAIHRGKVKSHAGLMGAAFTFSALFIVSYLAHMFLAGNTRYPGAGFKQILYLVLLGSHILAAIVAFPLVLITITRGVRRQNERHKGVARYAFPLWLYVSITGVMVYLIISPFYPR